MFWIANYLVSGRAVLLLLQLSMPHHDKVVHTLLMRKLPQRKYHPSWSRGFVAFKRKLAWQRQDVCYPLGAWTSWLGPGQLTRLAVLMQSSDGIARVHGMNNVQAEELVE